MILLFSVMVKRGTLTNQLKDGRWEAQVGLIKMTLEEKEFDLVQAQQGSPSQEKNKSMSSNELLVVVRKPDWIFVANGTKRP